MEERVNKVDEYSFARLTLHFVFVHLKCLIKAKLVVNCDECEKTRKKRELFMIVQMLRENFRFN